MANIIDRTNKPVCSICGGAHWNDQCQSLPVGHSIKEEAPKPTVSATQTMTEVTLCRVATHLSIVVPADLSPSLWASISYRQAVLKNGRNNPTLEPATVDLINREIQALIPVCLILGPTVYGKPLELTTNDALKLGRAITTASKLGLGDLEELQYAIIEALLATPVEPSPHY